MAREILGRRQTLDPAAEYRLVTNDYLANGGDSFSALQSPISREDLPVLLRDAFIDFVRHMGVIEPRLEGRISGRDRTMRRRRFLKIAGTGAAGSLFLPGWAGAVEPG